MVQFSCYAVYSSLDKINFRFLYLSRIISKEYLDRVLQNKPVLLYRKVKGKSRGSSKGHKRDTKRTQGSADEMCSC